MNRFKAAKLAPSKATVDRRTVMLSMALSVSLQACGGGDDLPVTDQTAQDGSDELEANRQYALGTSTSSIKLNDWDLELPVNSKGKLSGEALTLNDNKTHKVVKVENYFKLTSDGYFFYSPAFGAKTSSEAGGARCELKQDKEHRWNAFSDYRYLTLNQILKSTQSGTKPRVVIGQIHDNTRNLVMIKYYGPSNATGTNDKGVIKAVFNSEPNDEEVVLDDAYKLGEKMTVIIGCKNKKGFVEYTKGKTAVSASRTIDTDNVKGGTYFKVGVYPQEIGADPGGNSGARLTISTVKQSVVT